MAWVRGWLLMVGGVVIGLGVVVWRSLSEPRPPAVEADVGTRIKAMSVMSELAPDKPLRLQVSGSFKDLGSETKLFFASQGVFTGTVGPDAVETLIARGRVEALEHRLEASARDRLRAALDEFDEALRDISLLIDEEETRVKERLRARQDRHIRLTRPRERDPRYLELLATRTQLAANKTGVVWGLNDGPDEVHVIVRWEEWPALAAMNEDRFHMLAERAKRVRGWIDDEYRARGLLLFEQIASTTPATVRSPVDGR